MQDSPSTRDLITAVAQFLQIEIAPTLTDHRLKFRALVAANVLTIIGRELEMSDTQLQAERERLHQVFSLATILPSPYGRGAGGEGIDGNGRAETEQLTRDLARLIRAGKAEEGAFHDAVFAHIEQTVIEKLEIANPKFLERVRQETR